MKKRVAILGSTGSIGCQTLNILKYFSDQFEVFALSAFSNVNLLAKQVNELQPKYVIVPDSIHFQEKLGFQSRTKKVSGPSALIEISQHPDVDVVIVAIPGSDALLPTWAAVEAGKIIGLASKEVFVMAGKNLKNLANRSKAQILPIDSELGALLQCMQGEQLQSVRKMILTCSGGISHRFGVKDKDNLAVDVILNHPNWSMGKKISIDSATLVNKAFELIETYYYFDVLPDQVEVLIHPQSFIHSMVEFLDGSVRAHLSARDMRIFIQYVLLYPHLVEGPSDIIDWAQIGKLTFEKPNPMQLIPIRIAQDVYQQSGTYPAVFCGSNDEAVNSFLNGKIKLSQILKIIQTVLNAHNPITDPSIEDIIDAHRWAVEEVRRLISINTANFTKTTF